MYKLLLILKYLRKRRIAWVSLIAVMLCTAMVLVVISIMGGWLRMFEENFRKLTGDVVVSAHTLNGFPYYERMVAKFEAQPDVLAAATMIDAYGLLDINNKKTEGVQVVGLQLDKMGKVNDFTRSLYWQYQHYIDESKKPGLTAEQRQELLRKADDTVAHASFTYSPLNPTDYEVLKQQEKRDKWPGMILGNDLLEIRKDAKGRTQGRDLWKYGLWAKLVVFDPENPDMKDVIPRRFWIADDSHTGAWQFDSKSVYVPFDVAQRDMGMDAKELTTTNNQTIIKPARTHEIHIRMKPGTDLVAARDRIQTIVDSVMEDARRENAALGAPSKWTDVYPEAQTWRQNKADFLSAVENEKVLVVFLFSIISVVAVFLIFCIFYMIVMEKTQDIGIIKSVGATSGGVAAVFLGYGAAIGIVGGGLGFAAGFLIVHNINYIHQQLGHWLGIEIWRPDVYVFDTIPNTIDPRDAIVIVSIAIISSVIGALVPAVRAARMNPVEAVRYE